MVSSKGMEPTKFDSIRKAAKAIGVRQGVIRYARNNGRDFIKRFEDENVKVFFIMWFDLMQVKCLTVPSNADQLGWTQEYT